LTGFPSSSNSGTIPGKGRGKIHDVRRNQLLNEVTTTVEVSFHTVDDTKISKRLGTLKS
jgi:hypothetical protein